jgi:hypothetical protein
MGAPLSQHIPLPITITKNQRSSRTTLVQDGDRSRSFSPNATVMLWRSCESRLADIGKSVKRRGHTGEDDVGSGADPDRRQAGPNETVSGTSTPGPVVTFRDETCRHRVAADGREWADSDGRQHVSRIPGGWLGCRPPEYRTPGEPVGRTRQGYRSNLGGLHPSRGGLTSQNPASFPSQETGVPAGSPSKADPGDVFGPRSGQGRGRRRAVV